MMLIGPLFLLSACVVENSVNDQKDPPDPFDSGDPWTPPDSGVDSEGIQEECDGVDNNDNGEVDEGFPDADGDGIADCVDVNSCTTDLASPRSETDEECTGGEVLGAPPADPWNAIIEWQWTGGQAYSTPTVGDLDLDGVPEVVATVSTTGSYFPGDLIILDGATGTQENILKGVVDATGGVALGDLDLDGFGDIVTFSYVGSTRSVIAYDRNLVEMWTVASSAREENYPVIADLEGDGKPEVIVNEQIIDGATGTVIATLDGATSTWGANAVADLDLDGVQEIMLENGVYKADGSKLFDCGTGGTGSFPQPVNADSDDEGEVLIAGYGRMTLCDDDGTELWSRTYGNYGTAVAVADFDGDGMQEYAFANTSQLYLIEPDNSNRWTAPMNDYSGLSGCTSWDIDMDGVPEVIFADENDILVYSGADGSVVLQNGSHASVTLAETPAVADVDGDGHGELIYPSNAGTFGITVIGGADGDWPYSPAVYNEYTYYGGNINEDLSVPTNPEPPWIYEANLFRGQPSALYIAGTPNLSARIEEACAATCSDGYAEVSVQVWNDGSQQAPAGAILELWSDAGGSDTLVDSISLPEVPAAGSVETRFVTTQGWLGTHLWVEVDADGRVEECDEDDNLGDYNDVPCE